MASQRPGPTGIHADVAGESSGLHPGGDHRSDRRPWTSHGRADPDPGASSGARQRPAAISRVSRPARATRGRSAPRSRPSEAHGSSARSEHATCVLQLCLRAASYTNNAAAIWPSRCCASGSSDLMVLVVDDDFMVATIHAELVDETPGFRVAGTAG